MLMIQGSSLNPSTGSQETAFLAYAINTLQRCGWEYLRYRLWETARSPEEAQRIPGRPLNDENRPRLRYAASRLQDFALRPKPLFLNSAFQPTGE
jgi:hypothetical protein